MGGEVDIDELALEAGRRFVAQNAWQDQEADALPSAGQCETYAAGQTILMIGNLYSVPYQGYTIPLKPSCPCCGYCPHCGRRNDYTWPYPYQPYQPYPTWAPPFTYTCGTTTIPFGTVSALGNTTIPMAGGQGGQGAASANLC